MKLVLISGVVLHDEWLDGISRASVEQSTSRGARRAWPASARARQGLRGSTPPHFLYFSVFRILHFEFCILCFVFCTLYFVFCILYWMSSARARQGLGASTPPHCSAFITAACSTMVRPRALIPLFPRVMTMSLSRPATHLYLVNWPTSTAAWTTPRCSWPTIYPRLSGPACPPPRDHSLPGFLSTTTQRPSCFRVHHI